MDISDDVSDYWKNQKIGGDDIANSPDAYSSAAINNRGLNITNSLKELNISKDATILEMGCNVGRNLNFLYEHDFKNLTGVEICKDAIELGKKKYEELFQSSTFNIFNERCRDFVNNNNNNKYDVVYTMAVLVHINNPEREIFYEYLKTNVKYAIFVEPKNITRPHRRVGKQLFNVSDYELQMEKRGFLTISNKESLGRLGKTYNTFIFKNKNLN